MKTSEEERNKNKRNKEGVEKQEKTESTSMKGKERNKERKAVNENLGKDMSQYERKEDKINRNEINRKGKETKKEAKE